MRKALLSTGLSEEDEIRLGKKLQVDLSNTSQYWHEFAIVMSDKEAELDISTAKQELQYLFLIGGHKRIAKSITDSDFGIKDYYIIDENKEAEVANSKASVKIEAYTLYGSLSAENKKDILKLYPGFTNLDSVSPSVIEAKLYEQLEKDPAKFVAQAKDKKRDSKILLKELVQAGILRKNKSSYYYGDDFIGHDEESALTYIDDTSRQSLKVDLMAQLNSSDKKKSK